MLEGGFGIDKLCRRENMADWTAHISEKSRNSTLWKGVLSSFWSDVSEMVAVRNMDIMDSAWMIREKNLKQKISSHCPFKGYFSMTIFFSRRNIPLLSFQPRKTGRKPCLGSCWFAGSYSGAVDHWRRIGGTGPWKGYDLRFMAFKYNL
jgi:hypothetical protein